MAIKGMGEIHVHTMLTYRGSSGIAPLILDLATR